MNITQDTSYDIIVIGGGHAGIEAAHAAATMGSKTALISLDISKIGLMPCNPSIGGVGKGHIVFEISALGGLMPQLCTQTYLQARMLNTSKGAAVHGLRLQIDKHAYNKKSIEYLKKTENLSLIEGMVDHILLENNTVCGVQLADGTQLRASAVVVTTGTFLNGLIHIGDVQRPAGRDGEATVTTLARWFYDRGLKMGRLKTGTPPRLRRDSIDFSKLEYQECEPLSYLFEFDHHHVVNSHACYIARTNENTHEIIRSNIGKSAMYSGNIKGVGPRYCPSIEDKIMRFADKASHQIFVEPEGVNDPNIYPSGISTSLPLEVQTAYIQSIEGFESAHIAKAGYAVEYDFVLPNQLHHTLEVKTTKGLYLAGQINGTTGYEEAAGQGLIAGINAALQTKNQKPFILSRTESYIGVMIDDLVTLSVDEPYRMFTSRAERRLTLRQDNAFFRLYTYAHALGMISDQQFKKINDEKMIVFECIEKIKTSKPRAELARLIAEPTCNADALRAALDVTLSDRSMHTIHAELHYAPYLEREEREIKRTEHYKNLRIPSTLIYRDLPGLSKELQQKLNSIQPATIAQAALIPGMTPAALSLLIVTMRRKEVKRISNSNG